MQIKHKTPYIINFAKDDDYGISAMIDTDFTDVVVPYQIICYLNRKSESVPKTGPFVVTDVQDSRNDEKSEKKYCVVDGFYLDDRLPSDAYHRSFVYNLGDHLEFCQLIRSRYGEYTDIELMYLWTHRNYGIACVRKDVGKHTPPVYDMWMIYKTDKEEDLTILYIIESKYPSGWNLHYPISFEYPIIMHRTISDIYRRPEPTEFEDGPSDCVYDMKSPGDGEQVIYLAYDPMKDTSVSLEEGIKMINWCADENSEIAKTHGIVEAIRKHAGQPMKPTYIGYHMNMTRLLEAYRRYTRKTTNYESAESELL